MKPFYKGRYKSIYISKSKAQVVCPVSNQSRYPNHAIGIKLGDPFAATYKFHASNHFAAALDFGAASSGLYNKYHRENFNRYARENSMSDLQGINYLGHLVNSEWVFEGKLLYQRDAFKLLKGLQWYIGGGWQWRKPNIDYEYFIKSSLSENEIGYLNVSKITMGATGVLGFEHAYAYLPISAFMEIEILGDMKEDPGWIRIQGGIGFRYNL